MSATIRQIREADDEEWDAIWRQCPYATYFHSREWAAVWEIYEEGYLYPAPRLVEFSDGVRALLPLSNYRKCRGLANMVLSSPAGTYGGWIAADPLTPAHAELLHRYLRETGSLYWRVNPYDPLQSNLQIASGARDDTQVIDLTGGFEPILAYWMKGGRTVGQEIRKARGEGVLVRPALSYDEWLQYYDIYEESLRRWGETASSRYGMALFAELWRRQSPHVTLWLAMYQGEPATGALCFHAARHTVYWHGAARERFLKLRPISLLLHDVIKNACDRGQAWFDFNPSGSHEGVRRFKARMGAQTVPCSVVSIEGVRWRVARVLAKAAGRM